MDEDLPISKVWRADMMKSKKYTSRDFIDVFGNTHEAGEFENQALSIGSEYLSPEACKVLKGETLDEGEESKYWQWLIEQTEG